MEFTWENLVTVAGAAVFVAAFIQVVKSIVGKDYDLDVWWFRCLVLVLSAAVLIVATAIWAPPITWSTAVLCVLNGFAVYMIVYGIKSEVVKPIVARKKINK